MKWYSGYILASGNIAIGADRKDGVYVKRENQSVFINIENGVAIKIERHENKKLDKIITTRQMYALGGTSDNDFFLFEDTESTTFEEILKG